MDDNAKRREALTDIREATKRMIKQSMEEDGVASETTPEELSHIVVSSWEMLEPTPPSGAFLSVAWAYVYDICVEVMAENAGLPATYFKGENN